MRFERVLLVSPPSGSHYGGLRLPAGVGYIAQSLYDNAIEYDFIDMRLGFRFGALKRKAKEFEPDLIGISMITLEYKQTYRMIARIKEVIPGIKIVVGGHHITILKEEVLEECNEIDFGVVSDGERTIVELCKGELAAKDIKGLISREEGRVVFGGARVPLENLDEYAFPRYFGFKVENYSKQISIHSSRGCPNRCTFCPNKLIGGKFRMRSVDNFVDEIEYWYGRGIRQFAIDDDNFTLLSKRVHDICDEIERRNLKKLFIRCSNGVRADRVDRHLLSRMKEVGVRELGFGVDGGNNEMLGHLKKGETIETIEQAIKDACELGFDVRLFFLVGSPHETIADIEDSMRLAEKYPVVLLNVNSPIPYPGTEMYDYVKENNLFLMPPAKYLNEIAEEKPTPVFATPELSKEDRIRMLKRFHKVGENVKKKAVLRMYKQHPFVGLGIKCLFNVKLFERLFFNSLLFRKLAESIRYRKLIEG